MHSSRIREIVNTILILTGLVLLVVYGSKAASQATSWQAVNGKRHSLPVPNGFSTAAFIMNSRQTKDAPVQQVADAEPVNQPSADAADAHDTPAPDDQTKALPPQPDQAAAPDNRAPPTNQKPASDNPARHDAKSAEQRD